MNGLGFELSRFLRAHLHMVILVKDLVVLAFLHAQREWCYVSTELPLA
jgi:hypothetical protein